MENLSTCVLEFMIAAGRRNSRLRYASVIEPTPRGIPASTGVTHLPPAPTLSIVFAFIVMEEVHDLVAKDNRNDCDDRNDRKDDDALRDVTVHQAVCRIGRDDDTRDAAHVRQNEEIAHAHIRERD